MKIKNIIYLCVIFWELVRFYAFFFIGSLLIPGINYNGFLFYFMITLLAPHLVTIALAILLFSRKYQRPRVGHVILNMLVLIKILQTVPIVLWALRELVSGNLLIGREHIVYLAGLIMTIDLIFAVLLLFFKKRLIVGRAISTAVAAVSFSANRATGK